MKKNKKWSQYPAYILIVFALSFALLLTGFIGSAHATLTYFTDDYEAQFRVSDIGVTLVENGENVSWRNYTGNGDVWHENIGSLLTGLVPSGEQFQLGRNYKEEIAVRNSGSIATYNRVVLTRYWVDANGNKVTSLSPDWIDLHFPGNGWVEDESAATYERNIFYYTRPLASGEVSPLLCDGLSISTELSRKVTESTYVDSDGVTHVTAVFDYDGYSFVLEAEVDAVQTHNAVAAIKSAWGCNVTVGADGVLSIVKEG